MFHWSDGTHQTNGATANYGVGGYASTATPVPVATVCECFGCPLLGLIHNFSQQARPIGAAGGFASRTLYLLSMRAAEDDIAKAMM